MKNPLRKRLFRELKGEAGKYFVIFFLLMSIIGFVSGFLVADGRLLTMKALRNIILKMGISR